MQLGFRTYRVKLRNHGLFSRTRTCSADVWWPAGFGRGILLFRREIAVPVGAPAGRYSVRRKAHDVLFSDYYEPAFERGTEFVVLAALAFAAVTRNWFLPLALIPSLKDQESGMKGHRYTE